VLILKVVLVRAIFWMCTAGGGVGGGDGGGEGGGEGGGGLGGGGGGGEGGGGLGGGQGGSAMQERRPPHQLARSRVSGAASGFVGPRTAGGVCGKWSSSR
jgi:hypothetical protein